MGQLILVSGEHHKTGQGVDTLKHYESLKDFSHNLFTVQDIPYRWSTQDCTTLDDVPYIGNLTSKTPNLFIATGYRKWGMTNSTVASIILKDLITSGKSKWKDVYNPSRHTIAASAKHFIVENLNVAKELIEGKIQPIPDNIEIEPGEAKVIKENGQRTGAYKDKKGTLHLVNTTCTHMGCELNWNSAEKSWDCPCHGSRFTYEGEIIEGPAVKQLTCDNNVNTVSKIIKDKF
jgi:Rieske Fe-S protein